jgi:sulfate permease, SulP family
MPPSSPSSSPPPRSVVWQEAPQPRASISGAWAAVASALGSPRSWLPPLGLVRAARVYAASGWQDSLSSDVGAGVVVAVMLIPQALAYASLAGMPPVTGFYAAIGALFLYPLFGSSGHQAVGPVALMSIMSRSAVDAVVPAGDDADGAAARFAQVSGRLAFLIGLIQVAMGIARAGYLINFLSHPVLAGFTSASALIIASSQLGKALRLPIPQYDVVWETWADVVHKIKGAHGPSVALFVADLVLFYAVTLLRQRIAASKTVKSRPLLSALVRLLSVALIVVTFNILLVGLARLDTSAGIKVLGRIPSGLPVSTISTVLGDGGGEDGSAVSFSADAIAILPSALLISLVSYVESASVAKTMQAKYGVPKGGGKGVDTDAELLGLGGANLAAALLGGFPTTGGFSRSGVQAEAGARTVGTGLVAGTLLCILAAFATSAFVYLPDVALAAMIVFSAVRLLESQTPRYLWAVDKADAAVYWTTVVVILGAGIETGLMAGAGLSLLRLVREAAAPHTAVLGRMPDGVTFRNVARFPGMVQAVEGLLIMRMDGPLFFANVSVFAERVVGECFPQASSSSSSSSSSSTTVAAPPRAVLLDLSGVPTVDSSGVHMLLDTLPQELKAAAERVAAAKAKLLGSAAPRPPIATQPIRLFLIGVHGPVRDRLQAGEAAHRAEHARTHAAARTGRTSGGRWGWVAAPVRSCGGRTLEICWRRGGLAEAAPAVQPPPVQTPHVAAIDVADDDEVRVEDNDEGGASERARLGGPGGKRGTEGEGEGEGALLGGGAVAEGAVWTGLTPLILHHPTAAASMLRQVDVAPAVDAILALLEMEDGEAAAAAAAAAAGSVAAPLVPAEGAVGGAV